MNVILKQIEQLNLIFQYFIKRCLFTDNIYKYDILFIYQIIMQASIVLQLQITLFIYIFVICKYMYIYIYIYIYIYTAYYIERKKERKLMPRQTIFTFENVWSALNQLSRIINPISKLRKNDSITRRTVL